MVTIADFSGSELELLASLPYKVGVFISHADDAEGELDDDREMAALETCIKAITKLHEDKPFTADIMRQCISMKMDWPRWAAQSFNVPEEAGRAAALLQGKASESEYKNYCSALMEIATTVAQAYGEFGEFDDDDSSGGVFGGLVSKITGTLSSLASDDADHPMNVSPAEDSALAALKAALKP